MKMLSSSLAFLFFIATAHSVLNTGGTEDERLRAFRRCVADNDLPQLNTSKPRCPVTKTQLLNIAANSRYQQQYNFGCDDLMRFADYAESRNLELEELSFFSLNTTHTPWLDVAARRCYYSISNELCDEYDLCLTRNVTLMYLKHSCTMEFMSLVSRRTNGAFSNKIFTYVMALNLLRSYYEAYYTGNYNSAITQHYLYTCTSGSESDNLENCLISLLDHCFALEDVYYYYPYWCYLGVMNRLCVQFKGDERLRCRILIETRLEVSLENQCANENNEGKCEKILTSIVDEKPIANLNSTDIDQVKAVVAGSSRRANYTNETLTQLNRIVDYFTLNESVVSQNIDKQDANTFLSVISTLASDEGTKNLRENSTNNSGAMLLHDLDEISKVIGSAVVTENEQIEGNYAYNDENIGFFLAVGSSDTNYSSGALKLNKTDTASANMTAEISISANSICGSTTDETIGSGDDFDYYYDYPKICQGRPKCYRYVDGYWYLYYDLYTIFGDCSKKLKIPNSCPSVVATSIADKLPLLLSDDLPSNMTIASLVISSQIVMKNEDNSTSVTHSLKENATLNFKLLKPVNLAEYIPRCYYWDTEENMWSDVGIETQVLTNDEVKCITNHLTSFAVLVDHQGLIGSTENSTSIIPSTERQALSIVGYIGPSFSLVCLIIALVIMICLRKKMNTTFLYFVHINLCISLILALSVLIVGLETADHYSWLCSIVAGLLHYLFLCVFAWMLAEGITLCIMVTYVFGIKFLKWQIFVPAAWGIPILIVAIAAGVRYDLYGTENYCWLSTEKGLIWAFLGPALGVALVNTIFLIITVTQLVRVTCSKVDTNNSKRSKNFQAAKSAIFGTIILFPLLGITWTIGVFGVSRDTTFFLWLFTICNSLQGVFILIFHVLKHKVVLTWLARRFPCLDRWIEVHTSAEASRRMSKQKLSIGHDPKLPKRRLSDQFGIISQVEESSVATDLEPIIEELEDDDI